MNETVTPVSKKERAVAFEMSHDSAMLFRLSLELYRGEPLSDRVREYLDSIVPEPAIVLLVGGKEYLHPDNFEAVPLSVVRDSVIENRAGIYRRRLDDNFNGPIQGPELCASLIGKNARGEDLAAGILCPGGWEYDGCNHDLFYSLMSQLRSFYGDFTDSKTVARIISSDDSYSYVIDPVELNVISSTIPAFTGDPDSRNKQRYRANSLIEELLDNNFQIPSEKLSESKFKNLQITRFSIRDHQYLLVSFEFANEKSAIENDTDAVVRLFVHRINNKLAALQTAADQLMLQAGDVIDSDDLILAGVIKTESESVGRIIKRLGEYSRCGKNQDESIDLKKTLDNAVARIRKVRTDASVDYEPMVAKVPFRGDTEQIETALIELLQNAMENGGNVSVKMIFGDEIRISIFNILDRNEIKLFTSSTFDPFEPFRTRHSGKTGMGLCIARRIVAAHNGRIEINKENAAGLRFDICFPAQDKRRELTCEQ